jgi:hypothetical protein
MRDMKSVIMGKSTYRDEDHGQAERDNTTETIY